MQYITIEPHDKESGNSKAGESFVAQVNPSSMKMSHKIRYNGDGENGTENGQSKAVDQLSFKTADPQTLSFELILDGSGVLREKSNNEKTVAQQIEKFKQTCYFYKGDIHEPPYVKILWNGESLMKYKNKSYAARLKSFDITYLKFSPEGEPLRAKINASFVGTMDPKTEVKVKENSSPDLTHQITVKAGDTLPMLCQKVYGDRQMFHEVARVNNLLSFRHIEPGTELIFPPIK
jgi:LysM repeat protein